MSAGEIIVDANGPDQRARRIRARNRALGLLLLGLVVLFYIVAMVRMGGG